MNKGLFGHGGRMGALFFCLLLLACEKNAGEKTPGHGAKQGESLPPKEEAVKGDSGPGGSGRGPGRSRSSGPVPVRVTTVERKVAPRLVDVTAPLVGQKQVDLYSKVTGRMTFMGAREGEPVQAGTILFRVDRSDPGESFLSVPTISPLSGWIGLWHVTNVGEQVTPAEPVVTVVDDRILRATASLPVDDWLEVQKDTQVTALFGSEERRARLVSIARAADRGTGRGSVTVELENANRDWRSGIFVRLRFAVTPKERILLSAGALTITDENAFIYSVEGEVARRTAVEFAVFDADTVEITKGLAAGTKVVTAGANLLGDKSPVRILE